MGRFATRQELSTIAGGVPEAPIDGTAYARKNAAWDAIAGGGDALKADNLDQFASVTQTAGKTLAITDNTTLNGGTHSGTNTGDSASEPAGSLATHAALPNVHHNRSHAITSTSDHTSGNWKVFHSNGAGQLVEAALGLSGSVLQSNGAASAPTFVNVYGKGVVVIQAAATGVTATDTAVIQAALNALVDGDTLLIPGGNWACNPLTCTKSRVWIKGIGRGKTYIYTHPTADGQVGFEWNNGAQLYNCSLTDITFIAGNTTYNHTGVRLVDMAETMLRHIHIIGYGGAGKDSIALEVQGREMLWCEDYYFGANVPLYLNKNPNTSLGWLSTDHFTFRNGVLNATDYSTPTTYPPAVVWLHPQVQPSQLVFSGSQAWLLGAGGYGLYKNAYDYAPYNADPTHPELYFYTYSAGLRIENLRTEQGAGALWSIYYRDAINGYNLRNMSIVNCELAEPYPALYARNVQNIGIYDTLLNQLAATAVTILDVDLFKSMTWSNVYTNPTAYGPGNVNVNGATLKFQVPVTTGWTYPTTAVWGIGATLSSLYEAAGGIATHAALTTTHGISAFGATLVDDVDAAAARTTLGLGSAATLPQVLARSLGA